MTEAHVSPAKYLWIWVWLAGLMLVGVALSAVPLPKTAIIFLIVLLSTIKATLVALYYMHLKSDKQALVLVAVFPLVLIGLAVLVILSSRLVRL